MPKYKNKKELDNGTIVYEYSDRQIQKRHDEKAQRYQKLEENISSLRSKVRADVDSKDVVKRMTALAVAIMDETASRVGNDTSAENGHFGITTLRKKHVTFSKGKARLKYVGKSGVQQEKEIKNSKLINVLKEMLQDKGKEDPIFECEKDGDSFCVRASDVNTYLKEFDITAKDLRGYHANQKMIDALNEVRKKKLPTDKKERESLLKEEFNEALTLVAEDLGHEGATLKNNYLVPGLEESFMKDGTIIKIQTKKASWDVIRTEINTYEKPLLRLSELEERYMNSQRIAIAAQVAAAYMKIARPQVGTIAAIPGKWVLLSKEVRGTLRYFLESSGGNYREIDRRYAEELYQKATRRFMAAQDAFPIDWW